MARIVTAVWLFIAGVAWAEPMAHRSWQFHHDHWDYLQEAIPKAAAAGMNRIQLSHNIVMDAEQLWEGDRSEQRLDLVRKAVALAHQQGLAVDLWTHELSGVPNEYQEGGRVRLDVALWQWLREKYEKLFALVPGLDGLVLTFAETEFAVYRDNRVISDEPETARFVRLIDVLSEVCQRHQATLLVRTFLYEPHEIAWIQEALGAVAREVAPQRGNIVVMSKCVPHDWSPYYPYNPAIGRVGGLPQVVELDLGQEFTGQSKILHCEVDYVHRVLAHARQQGCVGAVARVERYGNLALGTPNEVNIHAYSRLLHDPSLSVDALWNEWATARYGALAAPPVIRALGCTFDITNLSYFPLEYWIVDHSRLPDWGYAHGHITSRELAKWIPSPKYERARDRLLHPDEDTLVEIDREKDLAREYARASLADLRRARPHLSEGDYAELKRYLELGADNVEVFRHHNLALFTTLMHQTRKKAGDATPDELADIRDRVLEHTDALRDWADRMERRYGKDIWPGNPGRIRGFAEETEKRLGG